MSSSNCCFLTCIQISQEASQVVWYSHLFQNFPQRSEDGLVDGHLEYIVDALSLELHFESLSLEALAVA